MAGVLRAVAGRLATVLFRNHQLPRHALAKVAVEGTPEGVVASVITHFRKGEFKTYHFPVSCDGREYRALLPHWQFPEKGVEVVTVSPEELAQKVMDAVAPGLSAFEVNGQRIPPHLVVPDIPFIDLEGCRSLFLMPPGGERRA